MAGHRPQACRCHLEAKPWQFGIRTLLLVTAAVAIVCSLVQSFPKWFWREIVPCTVAGYVALLLLAFSCCLPRSGNHRQTAWLLIAIGWQLVLVDVACGIYKSFAFLGGPPPAHRMQMRLYNALVATILLPWLLTIAAVFLASGRGGNGLHLTTKWLIVATMVAFLDVLLIVVGSGAIVRRTWPW